MFVYIGVSYPLICHSLGTVILSKPVKSAPRFWKPSGISETFSQYLKSHSPERFKRYSDLFLSPERAESRVAKGIKYNSISNIFYMLKILIPNLLKKVNDIDYSLSAKGFNE